MSLRRYHEAPFLQKLFVDICKLVINNELILQILITKVNLLLRVKRPSKNIPYAPTPVDGGGVTAAAVASVVQLSGHLSAFILSKLWDWM